MRKMGAARSLIEIVKKYYLRIIVIAHHSYWSVKPWSVSAEASSYFAIILPTPPRFPVTCLLAVQQTERISGIWQRVFMGKLAL